MRHSERAVENLVRRVARNVDRRTRDADVRDGRRPGARAPAARRARRDDLRLARRGICAPGAGGRPHGHGEVEVRTHGSRRSRPRSSPQKYPDGRAPSDRGGFQLTALQGAQARQDATGSPSGRSASRRPPGSTTSRTRRSTRPGTSRTPPGPATSPARSSPAARRRTRSRRAGWASTTAPASTAPTPRLDRHATPRTAASGCSSRTSSSSTTRSRRRAGLHRLSAPATPDLVDRRPPPSRARAGRRGGRSVEGRACR